MKENSFEIKDNSEMMKMSPWDFDQSNNGWRKFEEAKDYLRASQTIKEYIEKNKILVQEGNVLKILNFHLGQNFAQAGEKYYSQAIIEGFGNSFQENREEWNAYVSGTIGFLKNDIKKIKDAIDLVESSTREEKKDGNMHALIKLKQGLEIGERDYRKSMLGEFAK
jgi:hypothetical protein